MPEDREHLDDFDLDLDDILEDVEGEESIPKSRVTEIVKNRLAREKSKWSKFAEEFKAVYGVTPEEAIEFGKRERQKYVAAAPAAQVQPPAVPQVEDLPVAPAAVDPLARQKVQELDEWRRRAEEDRQREIEALEFVREFPGVKFEDIPQEVWQRRARGGVTLAEAYKLVTADQRMKEVAKTAAERVARSAAERRMLRTEGADYGAGQDESTSLTDEERQLARIYGMTPKEYAAYKRKAQELREQMGEEGY